MKYSEIIEDIERRVGKFKSKGNIRIKKFLEYFNSPNEKLKVIHIAGTNGKGSVSNFIKDMLKEDYVVGIFTSPHLITYRDRIKIGDMEITEEEFVNISEEILEREKNILEEYGELNLFEFITALAMIYFDRKKVDIVVLEVGMGGRADSTNIINTENKLISIITSISFDHMAFLGDNISEIAKAKAGIITEAGLAITSNRNPEVLKELINEADEKKAKLYYSYDLEREIIKSTLEENIFKLKIDREYEIKLNQIGIYQVENAILSIYALYLLNKYKKLEINIDKIIKNIENSKWAGRMEIVSKEPLILLDGAHNLDGINRLFESLKEFSFNKLYVIMSVLSDKEHEKMLEVISNYTDEVIFVPLDYKRNTSVEKLIEEAKEFKLKAFSTNFNEALNIYKGEFKIGDLILVTGSLYFVSEARAKILNYNYSI